jgi:hypothetical protein
MVQLKSAAQRLCEFLQSLPEPVKDNLKLLLIVDEASSLLERGNVRFISFNRVWSCLRRFSFWTFLLSTDSEFAALSRQTTSPPPSAQKILNKTRQAFGIRRRAIWSSHPNDWNVSSP